MIKLCFILALFIGESIAIYGEMLATKAKFEHAILYGIIGQLFLIYGYYLGYKALNNIWIVTVTSIASIIIAEPLIILITMREIPGRNVFIGCALGIIGLIVANIKD